MLRWLAENVPNSGRDIDRLFYLIYYITGVAFFLVAGAMVLFLMLYHRRGDQREKCTRGNTTLEIVWTLVPAVVLVVLSFMSQVTWGDSKGHLPPADVEVQITAKQWGWEVLYPGPDRQFGTLDDLQMDNELHVPINRAVRVRLRSKDVTHTFFLPSLRLKGEALPGREIAAWFEATRPGRYEIPCAELCGLGHSGMLGHLTVHPADEYDNWVKAHWPSPESRVHRVAAAQ